MENCSVWIDVNECKWGCCIARFDLQPVSKHQVEWPCNIRSRRDWLNTIYILYIKMLSSPNKNSSKNWTTHHSRPGLPSEVQSMFQIPCRSKRKNPAFIVTICSYSSSRMFSKTLWCVESEMVDVSSRPRNFFQTHIIYGPKDVFQFHRGFWGIFFLWSGMGLSWLTLRLSSKIC